MTMLSVAVSFSLFSSCSDSIALMPSGVAALPSASMLAGEVDGDQAQGRVVLGGPAGTTGPSTGRTSFTNVATSPASSAIFISPIHNAITPINPIANFTTLSACSNITPATRLTFTNPTWPNETSAAAMGGIVRQNGEPGQLRGDTVVAVFLGVVDHVQRVRHRAGECDVQFTSAVGRDQLRVDRLGEVIRDLLCQVVGFLRIRRKAQLDDGIVERQVGLRIDTGLDVDGFVVAGLVVAGGRVPRGQALDLDGQGLAVTVAVVG